MGLEDVNGGNISVNVESRVFWEAEREEPRRGCQLHEGETRAEGGVLTSGGNERMKDVNSRLLFDVH